MTLNNKKNNQVNLKEDMEIYRINEEQAEYDNANDTINSHQDKHNFANRPKTNSKMSIGHTSSSAVKDYADAGMSGSRATNSLNVSNTKSNKISI